MMESKKDIAVAFLQLVSLGEVRQACQKYEFPHKIFEVVRTPEDGNFVAIHGKARLKPDLPEIALIHNFSFKGDLVIEEWETAQEVPVDSPYAPFCPVA